MQAGTWQAAAWRPALGWADGWRDLASAGHVLTAFALVAPVAVPAGLAVAARAVGVADLAIETGLGGRTATAPVVFDARQWRRQARTARGRLAAPAPSRC